tara:strand:+ start:1297 stop:1413 length:117 start_codon:yes stop_codon:yes gene_type:complete
MSNTDFLLSLFFVIAIFGISFGITVWYTLERLKREKLK